MKWICKHCKKEDYNLRSYGIIVEGGNPETNPTKFVHEGCYEEYRAAQKAERPISELTVLDLANMVALHAYILRTKEKVSMWDVFGMAYDVARQKPGGE